MCPSNPSLHHSPFVRHTTIHIQQETLTTHYLEHVERKNCNIENLLGILGRNILLY